MEEIEDKLKSLENFITNNSDSNKSREETIDCFNNENKEIYTSGEIVNFQDNNKNDKSLISALIDNNTITAIEIAKKQYENLENQKNIANKMSKVVNRKTNADIDTANLKVEKQEKNNKVKKQEIKNELLKLKNEKIYMQREQMHQLKMQKTRHRLEKYGELLTRHCQKKVKDKDGKWQYQVDSNGKPLINAPNGFTLFWLIILDSIVQFLNLGAEVISKTNKVVLKSLGIIFIILLLLVPPFRDWLLSLIGVKF